MTTCVLRKGEPLSFFDAAVALRDGLLGALLDDVLSSPPHRNASRKSFLWELPPVSLATAGSASFCFVTLNAPHLDRASADGSPFDHFIGKRCNLAAATFSNLGGDALLVAPCHQHRWSVSEASYSHLAAFVSGAPAAIRHGFWRAVGAALLRTLHERRADAPTWLNTEGSGVAWVHVRLDSTPKYIKHEPFREWPAVRTSR